MNHPTGLALSHRDAQEVLRRARLSEHDWLPDSPFETALIVVVREAQVMGGRCPHGSLVRTIVFDRQRSRPIQVRVGPAHELEREIMLALQALARPLDALIYSGPKARMPSVLRFFHGAPSTHFVVQDAEMLLVLRSKNQVMTDASNDTINAPTRAVR